MEIKMNDVGDEIPTDVNDPEKLTLFKKTTYPPPGPRREKRQEYMKIYMRARRKKLKAKK